MKYLEESFKNTEKKKLYDDEIDIFRVLLSNLKKYESVESVLIMPYTRNNKTYQTIDDFSMSTIVMVNNKKRLKEIKQLIESAEMDIDNCDNGNEINFFVYDINDLDKRDFYFLKIALEVALVSGYILYDKNGLFENKQDELNHKINIITNQSQTLVSIDNINELDISSNKKRTLK